MIFNFGCPAMDILQNEDLSISNKIMSKYGGTGHPVDWNKPYMLMVQHPVTTSYGEGREQVEKTLKALLNFTDYQKIVLWPNIDAGSDDIAKGIRVFREQNLNEDFHYFRNFSPEDYARVLRNATCLIGNSSSFIREGEYLGIPAVIIGDRQGTREHGENIMLANYDKNDILKKIEMQLKTKRYNSKKIFGKGDAGKKIAEKLTNTKINIIKKNTY